MSAADSNPKPSVSRFARKFDLPSINNDLLLWNKGWDKVLHQLSAQEVYAVLSPIWASDKLQATDISRLLEDFKAWVLKSQNMTVKLWVDMEEKGDFVVAWLLLEESDRQTHLLNGLKQACEASSLLEDSRAMCPEVKISSMLKKSGKSYIDLIKSFTEGKKEVGEDNLYKLPSEWWENAVDESDLRSPEVESTFAILTLIRNEFISESHWTCLTSI